MHKMADWWGRASPTTKPYLALLNDLSLIPISHYLIAVLLITSAFLYHFLEFHFFHDLLTFFRGCPVSLTYHSSSLLYNDVVSKCRILHSRYLVTPWLSSPHVQTVFLTIFGRAPLFNYRRELFHLSDGGTIALDWLMSSDVLGSNFDRTSAIPKDDINPIVLAIPGLTSDSEAPYIKHLAFNTARNGWNVVVTNHRGLGGVSITSDCFYNAGWTKDLRAVINHLHDEYPHAPLFVVGTSIGANILVKYLGEDGDSVPVAGAVAICSPWDLLIGDRFISRRLMQKIYDRALAIGLQGYAQLHQPVYTRLANWEGIKKIGDRFISRRLLQKIYDRALAIGLQGYAQLHQPVYTRLANWEGIKKSRSIRDFDHHATRLVGKFETVDTYYRRCSSAGYVGNVSVPLLCISALDDPVCTREAIPWDECRANKNIVLATTMRGGHLAFFEGLTAGGIWWVRAVDEFLKVLHSSQHMHVKKVASSIPPLPVDSSIDQGPYVNIAEDGMVAAVGNEQVDENSVEDVLEPEEGKISAKQGQQRPESDSLAVMVQSSEQATMRLDVLAPVRRCLDLVSRQNRWSLWLLVYTAIVASWPVVGSVLQFALQKKRKKVLLGASLKR